ncbi:MAG: hypothetical protein OXR82_15725 [Gammaproteobacteria bacterium]|nr:hypothetical protein [Gammaproteobacteria bacterium]MDE0259820.1 hypothetical protein [Gammaproteobacteria bacterium]
MRHRSPAEPTARTTEPTARTSETPISSARTALSSLSIGKPTHFAGLTVFPLSSDLRSTVRYVLLEEGLSSGLVSVREVQNEGSVPNLAVENRSDSDVLIVDGEELVGAKQNRIANLTLLVPAKRTTTIPVSCVEAGRWSYSRPDFAVTERVQYSRGRAARLRGVQESMRTSGTRRSDQGAVWDDLSEKAARMEAHSPTEAMSAIYERHEGTLDEYVEKLSLESGQVGAIFVTGPRQFGMDLFDRHETFAAFFPKLVRSYAIDAMERPPARDGAAKPEDARAFVDRLREGAFDIHPAVALGHDVGIVARGAIAGALVHQETALHLTAFSEPARATEDHPGAYASYRQRRASLRRRRGRE